MPLDSTEYSDLTPEQIMVRMRDLKAEEQELKVQLAEAREQAIEDVVAQIRATAEEMGVDVTELARRLLPSKRKPAGRGRTHYRCKRTGNIYKGGRAPTWLVEQMDAAGMDYAQYRDAFMETV